MLTPFGTSPKPAARGGGLARKGHKHTICLRLAPGGGGRRGGGGEGGGGDQGQGTGRGGGAGAREKGLRTIKGISLFVGKEW